MLIEQASLHKADTFPKLHDLTFADDRADPGRGQISHAHLDGRRVERAFGVGEDRRSHGVVEHGGQEAALDDAGGVAELRSAFEPDPDPAVQGPGVEDPPAKELGAGAQKGLLSGGWSNTM